MIEQIQSYNRISDASKHHVSSIFSIADYAWLVLAHFRLSTSLINGEWFCMPEVDCLLEGL